MSIRTDRATAAVAATLALAAAAWLVTVRQMRGMDMGVATDLGPFAFFVGVWVPMMAAMMLPGALPAVARRARAADSVTRFAGSYLAVWALAGLAVFVVDRPHGYVVAGGLTIAAGVYELTPFKRRCRQRCRENVRSGLRFGAYCAGSSAGLMVMLIALGAMSITWMVVVTVIVVAQKLLPPRASIDLALALAIVAFGIATASM